MPLQIDILDRESDKFIPFASIPNGKRTSLRAIDLLSITDYQLHSHVSGRFSEVSDDMGKVLQRVQLFPYLLDTNIARGLKYFGAKLRFTNI